MPLFEHNYSALTEDGKPTRVPPRDVLARIGPVLQVAITVPPAFADQLTAAGKSVPQPVTDFALIDTGASITAVDEQACRKLGLQSTGSITMKHATGSEERLCYPIQILFPGTPLPSMINHQVASYNLSEEVLLLFGRDLLSRLHFIYNGVAGRIEIAF